MDKTTRLVKVKETKNTVRYDHPVGDVLVPAIYLQKSHLDQPYPEQIDVRITSVQ